VVYACHDGSDPLLGKRSTFPGDAGMYWIASNKSITDMQACAASAAPCRSEREFVGRLRVSGILHNGESELYFGVPKSQAEPARLLLDKGFAAHAQ
jgi:hypothetical protein